MDRFYTPESLASLLVSVSTLDRPEKIADFAAGDGALLKAALARWPDAKVVGMDVDPSAIAELAKAIPAAELEQNDFFAVSDQAQSVPSSADRLFDLVLLNPPFSCRGTATFAATLGGEMFKASKALAFVARALPFLNADGELIAILPSSCLTSERDLSLRRALHKHWDFVTIGSSHSDAFRRCSVTVDIVKLTRRSARSVSSVASDVPRSNISRGRLQLMRGSIANSRGSIEPRGAPFVHSTDLARGRIGPLSRWCANAKKSVAGSALLFPRVGRMRLDKLVHKQDSSTIILSDCVIACKTPDRLDESALLDLLQRDWSNFSRLWAGSCAPYVTMSRLQEAFTLLGYEVEIVENMVRDPRFDQRAGSEIKSGRQAVPVYL